MRFLVNCLVFTHLRIVRCVNTRKSLKRGIRRNTCNLGTKQPQQLTTHCYICNSVKPQGDSKWVEFAHTAHLLCVQGLSQQSHSYDCLHFLATGVSAPHPSHMSHSDYGGNLLD